MRAVKHAHADHAILRGAQDKLPRLSGKVGWRREGTFISRGASGVVGVLKR
jgi:hypothetical protein